MSRSDWMQTHSGIAFSFPPTPKMIAIGDIAHSLSMQCRYNGHCRTFYSVAEHSVLVSDWLLYNVGPAAARAGLLHDAGEAYLCDVPKPLKPMLGGYREASDALDRVIEARFGLPPGALDAEAVKVADYRILADEQAALMGPAPIPWRHHQDGPLGVRIHATSPDAAARDFLLTFERLFPAFRSEAA